MAKEEPKEGAEGAEAPKPKGKGKLIIIIVVVLLLAGGAGAFFMLGGSKEEGEHQEEEKPKEYKRAKMDTFIVNLSESKSFLKVTIQLEYDPDALLRVTSHEGGGEGHGGGGGGHEGGGDDGALPPEILAKEPVVRDSVIRVLSSKHAEEVLTVEGKATLKDELIEAINEALEFAEPIATNIYFTEFLIQ